MTSLFPNTRFLSKPCPLPYLICNNRSVLWFCYTISKYFQGLHPRPLLYSCAPEHISLTLESLLVSKTGHVPQHGTSHSNSLPRARDKTDCLSNINTGRMFLGLALGQARHTHWSHGSSHETLIVSSSPAVSPLLQCLHLWPSGCVGCPGSFSHIYCSNFLLVKPLCSQELALSILLQHYNSNM